MAELKQAKVPDIGNYTNIPVIEVLVKPGDTVARDQGLVTLESDKATMEVPAPFAGVVREVKVKVGDEVSEGVVVALIEAEEATAMALATATTPTKNETTISPLTPAGEAAARSAAGEGKANPAAIPGVASDRPAASSSAAVAASTPPAGGRGSQESAPRSPPIAFGADTVLPGKVPLASPVVRMIARELGVDLAQVSGSERNGRITKQDVRAFVKRLLEGGGPARAAGGGGGLNLLPWPSVDFSKFGEVETRPLSKIKKISGANLARNWAMIPHVTQHDEADITGLEALRAALNKEHEKAGIKFTLLAFIVKAAVAALKKYPDFNASLDASGENLILKKYFHIGFAADTPNGLVVPVLKNADQKGLLEIATESSDLAKKARDGKLGPADMSGGCFSISSLGGIGGTAFTPIVNAPEVAILGVSKSAIKPVWDGKAFTPRLILPLSLSYDHRVIDGAAAARFAAYLSQLLADMRRSLL
ncbi:MAG: dihydrolipoyllysine-residue acetyltransferase [Xanthomonadaceae bacterium]|nr:dihydrolipoyllysine-residue acetyltransferase [Xanthomonadaceae bacterium]MDE2083566.1 dihydrolipoyllysine-residue acetyltransferase [Xanthomonadaceae bacterium]